MSKVLFLCRFQKSPSDPIFQEIEESLNLRSVIENDFDKEKERGVLMSGKDTYDYAPMLFDLKDVATSNLVDVDHTSVRMYNSFNYTLKVPFEKYITIYQSLLGLALNDFTQADFNKPIDESTTE